jgi:hypothetical protein
LPQPEGPSSTASAPGGTCQSMASSTGVFTAVVDPAAPGTLQ